MLTKNSHAVIAYSVFHCVLNSDGSLGIFTSTEGEQEALITSLHRQLCGLCVMVQHDNFLVQLPDYTGSHWKHNHSLLTGVKPVPLL